MTISVLTLIPVILVQVDLGHNTLVVAVEHNGDTSEEIDSFVHGRWILELEHAALGIATNEELGILPWFRVCDVVNVLELLGLWVGVWA